MAYCSHRFRRSCTLILLTVSLVTLFLLVPAKVLLSTYKQAMLGEMEQRALAVANATAIFLENDSRSYSDLVRAAQENPKSIDRHYYTLVQEMFIRLREDANVDYLYTQAKTGPATAMLVLDSRRDANPLRPVFQGMGISSSCNQAFAQATGVTTGMMEHEEWGPSIFAHAPIMDNERGMVLGVVSTGFGIATLQNTVQNMSFIISGLFLLIIILVSLTICIVLKLREHSLEVEYLTHLGTKRYFETQLRRIALHTKTSKAPFSLLLLDIDGFKLINDTYGHLAGDKVLQTVGAIISANTQTSSICSRIGGDEFAIILTSTTLEGALAIAQTVQSVICEHTFEEYPALVLSVSIGVAQWNEDQTPQELIELADKALYKAKHMGRNTVSDMKS